MNSELDDLFVMSGSIDMKENRGRDEPMSVLVRQRDGEEIINLLADPTVSSASDPTEVEGGYRAKQPPIIHAIVQVQPQGGSSPWPIVDTKQPNTVQVLVAGGWGVIAVRKKDTNAQEENWQLFIVQHSQHTEAP